MIEVKNLSKYYQEKAAVDHISFRIHAGETMILLGTSGCGKTTTMKMINRLVEPSSGQVMLDGKDIRTLRPETLRRNIGYVIQNVGLFPHYTVKQNINLVPSLLNWSDKEIQERFYELMALMGLDDELQNRYPHELSGGQQQRVGVARALAAKPDLILLDEPFGALDPITKQQIQSEFLKLKALRQTTKLMVTHDVFEAVTLGDKICLMNAGKIQQTGTPHELVFHPKDAFVREFFDAQRFRLELQVLKLKDLLELTEVGNEPPTDVEQAIRIGSGASLLESLDQLERKDTEWLIIDHEQQEVILNRTKLLQLFYQRKESYRN